jgi:acyl carrier protein
MPPLQTTTTDLIRQTVWSRISVIARVPVAELDGDKHLFDVYGLDSIRALKLISDMEVEFDIDIEQEEARSICTLNDVVELIRTKSGASA